jgi:hypothetical protein
MLWSSWKARLDPIKRLLFITLFFESLGTWRLGILRLTFAGQTRALGVFAYGIPLKLGVEQMAELYLHMNLRLLMMRKGLMRTTMELGG